jgi:hypothetical protein
MKKITFLSVLIAVVIIAIFSCKKSTLNCLNGGQLKNGLCICKDGYNGETCEINLTNKLSGIYAISYGSTVCTLTPFEMIIEPSSVGNNYVIIKNIDNIGITVTGIVKYNITGTFPTQIEIPSQQIGSREVHGYIHLTADFQAGSAIIHNSSTNACEGNLTRVQ